MTGALQLMMEWISEHRYFLIALGVIAGASLWQHYRRRKEEKDFERYLNEKRD